MGCHQSDTRKDNFRCLGNLGAMALHNHGHGLVKCMLPFATQERLVSTTLHVQCCKQAPSQNSKVLSCVMVLCIVVRLATFLGGNLHAAARSARTAMKQLPNNKGENCHPHSLEIIKSAPPGFRDKTHGKKKRFKTNKLKTKSQKHRFCHAPTSQ